MAVPAFSNLFAPVLFGSAGFGAFVYGKKAMHWKAMVIGTLLMVYPYFIYNTLLLYVIGFALCLSLFVFRD